MASSEHGSPQSQSQASLTYPATPLRHSIRRTTPRKSQPGMLQPSSDSRITIALPKASGSKPPAQKNTVSKPVKQTPQAGPSKKRKKDESKSFQPPQDNLPSETKMNQDSDDGLSNCQKAKQAKVLEVNNKEEAPFYPHHREHFGDPDYKKDKPKVGKKMSYPCLWCHMIVRVVPDSLNNLKIHHCQ